MCLCVGGVSGGEWGGSGVTGLRGTDLVLGNGHVLGLTDDDIVQQGILPGRGRGGLDQEPVHGNIRCVCEYTYRKQNQLYAEQGVNMQGKLSSLGYHTCLRTSEL